MAGQNVERREVLRILALASGASQFPGFARWSFACPDHPENAPVKLPTTPYKPQFFSPEEYSTVEVLCDLIIPSDGTPGAREAGVSEFIDFMASSDPAIQFKFRYGLAWLNGHAQWLFRQTFSALSRDQQTDVFEHLAYHDKYRPGEEEGRIFFGLMREYTLLGFYTSRIGLEDLHYSGLQLFYDKDPMGCPHTDDREHKHLKPVND